MGGVNEKVLDQPTQQGAMSTGSVRVHTSGNEVHLHDDANQLKVAVAPDVFWARMNAVLSKTVPCVEFLDVKRETRATIRLTGVDNNIDADIQIAKVTMGSTLRQLSDFVNRV